MLKDKEMEQMKYLKVFHITDSPGLKFISLDAFYGVKSPTELVIQNNTLTKLDVNVFALLKNFESLTLVHTHITELSSSHFKQQNNNLHHLDLSHNKINRFVDGIMDATNNLTSLDLSDNMLTVIDATLLTRLGKYIQEIWTYFYQYKLLLNIQFFWFLY